MRLARLLPVLLLLSVACAAKLPPAPQVPPPPPSPRETVLRSLVRLEVTNPDSSGGVCSAFAVAPKVFLSAAHCVGMATPGAVLMLDHREAFILKVDVARDLLLLISNREEPALSIRPTPLTVGETIYSLGYAYGWQSPAGFVHHVALLHFVIKEDIWPGMIVENGFIGGMSGGPLYDRDARIVGIVQRSTAQVGYGVDAATIQAFLAAE